MNMGAELTALLYYYSSLWLLSGNVLSRALEIRQKHHTFLQEEGHENSSYFAQPDILLKLTYL